MKNYNIILLCMNILTLSGRKYVENIKKQKNIREFLYISIYHPIVFFFLNILSHYALHRPVSRNQHQCTCIINTILLLNYYYNRGKPNTINFIL